MSTLEDIRNEARDKLTVDALVIRRTGSVINIGEEFTVRFTVRNRFNGSNEDLPPGHPHFTDVNIQISATQFATPTEGNTITRHLTNHLGFGHSISTDVTFEALRNLDDGFLSWPSEPYAEVRVTGDFDISRFLKVVQRRVFHEQIADT